MLFEPTPLPSSSPSSSSSTSPGGLAMAAAAAAAASFLDHQKGAAAAAAAAAAASAAHHHQQQQPQTSSRILYDIPCKVCTDHSSGKHYGIFACDGCAGFFKRSIRRNRQYVCKAKSEGACVVDKTHRNQCRACRLKRCLSVGMNREAVQHERGPRNSTLRRQMSLYFKEHHPSVSPTAAAAAASRSSPPASGGSPLLLPPPPPLSMAPSCSSPVPAASAPRSSPLSSISAAMPSSSSSSSVTTTAASASSPLLDFSSPPKHPAAFHHFLAAASGHHHHHHQITPPPPPPPPTHLPFFVDPRLLAGMSAAAASAAASSSTVPSTPGSALPATPPYFPHPLAAAAAAFPRPPISSVSSGLLAPTPKYPHELSPPLSSGSPFPPPPSSPPSPSSDGLSEAAARLLFMNVRWAQSVPAFVSLPYKDQLALLEDTWRELFVLSAAQFSLPVEAAAAAALQGREETDVAAMTELKAFQETIAKFAELRVDATEFACLRAVVLLKTSLEAKSDSDTASSNSSSSSSSSSSPRELRDQAAVNALQDQAQLTLSQYVARAYPAQPQRFGKLLLLLPSLRAVSGRTVHSVFFRCIGAIPLEKIICDMFKARGV